jgi:DNA repair photolyase
MVMFKGVKAKTVLNKYKYRDNWFRCRYSINPYRGCQFACNYCNAITEKYLFHKNIEELKESIRTIHSKNALEKTWQKQLENL